MMFASETSGAESVDLVNERVNLCVEQAQLGVERCEGWSCCRWMLRRLDADERSNSVGQRLHEGSDDLVWDGLG